MMYVFVDRSVFDDPDPRPIMVVNGDNNKTRWTTEVVLPEGARVRYGPNGPPITDNVAKVWVEYDG